MTIKEFSDINNVSETTVKMWIDKGILPVYIDKNTNKVLIYEYARKPYTRAKAKEGSALYISMSNACANNMHILPKLYAMDEETFNMHIKLLVEAGIIKINDKNGYQLYDITEFASNQYKVNNKKFAKFVIDAISQIAGSVAEGLVRGYIKS